MPPAKENKTVAFEALASGPTRPGGLLLKCSKSNIVGEPFVPQRRSWLAKNAQRCRRRRGPLSGPWPTPGPMTRRTAGNQAKIFEEVAGPHGARRFLLPVRPARAFDRSRPNAHG